MKPLKTKSQVRAELEQEILRFENDGGKVKSVPRGVSGNLDNRNYFSKSFSDKAPDARTPVDEVVKNLESRKHPEQKTFRRPKKKLITDDFGEPLRWVWEDK